MAQKQDPSKDPSTRSAAYEYMAPKWTMIESLLGGTCTMRAEGETYLPRHPAETDDGYSRRLSQNILYNMTELTLKSLTGRVFREEMKMNDDVPQQVRDLSLDVDGKGTTLSSFSQTWFRESMAKGFAHCMIDMPMLSDEQKVNRTLADDAKENRRPVWSLIKPENAIFMYWEDDVLVHARIVETDCERVGFSEVAKLQIRVLEPGTWALWEDKNADNKGKKPDWQETESGVFDLPIVPILTFYTDQTGPMTAKPPLEDLAYMNVRHWQSTSDQINVLTVARFPMLAASGTQIENGKNSITIGPRQLLSMRDPNGKFYYVEHNGKSIASGKEELESLEDRMAAYGAEFLRRQVAGRTAFERAQDANEAISPLKDMALRFQESVNRALALTARWLNLPDTVHAGGTVTINTKFTEEDNTATDMKVLGDARSRFDISRRTFIEESIRRGTLEQTRNVDKELELILEEVKQGPFHPSFLQGQERIIIQETPGGKPQESKPINTPAGA